MEYVWIIKLSILFQLVWQSNALAGSIFYGLGKSKKLGIIAIVTGFSNLFLSLILVHYFGLNGVILGTVIVGIISVYLNIFGYSQILR